MFRPAFIALHPFCRKLFRLFRRTQDL